MSISTMDSRERLLSAIDFKEVDHLPFWPKLDGAYPGYHDNKTNSDYHRIIGSDVLNMYAFETVDIIYNDVEYSISE